MQNKLFRKGLVLGIIILFVGAGVIPSMGGTIVERHGSQGNKTSVMGFTTSGNILYVGGSGPSNYTKIQDAINDSSNGDTVFVYDYSSPYDENAIVGKSISLIGEDKHTTVIDGGNSGHVVSVSADWVNISGFTIQNSGDKWGNAGIDIRSNHNTITGNIISNNWNGICLRFFSSDNVITGNTISSNNRDGIRLWDSSDNNTIAGNIIISNLDGIYLYDSSSNTITCNNIILNDFGISLSQSSNNTILKNNFLNNKLQAIFNNCTNTWKQNYWNRPRILPKLIFGVKQTPPPWIPCLPDIDWRPALKPYDITTTQECDIDDLLRALDNPFLERFPLLNLLLQRLRI